MDVVKDTCSRCQGWVYHRMSPCNCEPVIIPDPQNHPEYLKLIGLRLRGTRKAKGWGLDALAEESGITKTGLWQIEKGQSEPMAKTLVALANALDVTTDYLLMR